MTNLTLDVNIIDFPSIPVAMLPHRCSPESVSYTHLTLPTTPYV